jgi:hypothetical protein
MASNVHKKRTGKGLKITEEIVKKEGMYEEEEDSPRWLANLTRHLQTNSETMNSRVRSFIENKVAMASIAAGLSHDDWLKSNPINQQFADAFPGSQMRDPIPPGVGVNPPYERPPGFRFPQRQVENIGDPANFFFQTGGPVASPSSVSVPGTERRHSRPGSISSPTAFYPGTPGSTVNSPGFQPLPVFQNNLSDNANFSPNHAMNAVAQFPMNQAGSPYPQHLQGRVSPHIHPAHQTFTGEISNEAMMLMLPMRLVEGREYDYNTNILDYHEIDGVPKIEATEQPAADPLNTALENNAARNNLSETASLGPSTENVVAHSDLAQSVIDQVAVEQVQQPGVRTPAGGEYNDFIDWDNSELVNWTGETNEGGNFGEQ